MPKIRVILKFNYYTYCLKYTYNFYRVREFYRHDPGEDSSAYPPCYIPNRVESWIPDELPEPSPKDTWAKHDLKVLEQPPEESLRKSSSISSIEYPVVEEIPPEYW